MDDEALDIDSSSLPSSSSMLDTSLGSSPDTIDVSGLSLTMASPWQSTYGNVTISTGATGATGSSFSYYSTPPSYTIGTQGALGIGTTSVSSGLHVRQDAEFEGDIKWKGRSLGKMLEKIEERLAIIQDPDPEKLEKFAALKKAYDHYKMIEKLIGDEK